MRSGSASFLPAVALLPRRHIPAAKVKKRGGRSQRSLLLQSSKSQALKKPHSKSKKDIETEERKLR
jgi:hypothetical protein